MKKKEVDSMTTKVFEFMQKMSSETGGESRFDMHREDGWIWSLVVTPPNLKDKEDE